MGFNTDEPMRVTGEMNGKEMNLELKLPQFQPMPFSMPEEPVFDADSVAATDSAVVKIRKVLHGLKISQVRRVLGQLELEAGGGIGYGPVFPLPPTAPAKPRGRNPRA